MQIKNLQLQYYRNYSQCDIDFAPGLNVFVGDNAQGKTNLLESVFFASIGRSPRLNKEKDLILWGQEKSKINVTVQKKYNKTNIQITILKGDKKTVKINSIPIKKIGELMGELTVVYFSPDEIKLVKEEPYDRRRFMDIDISQLSKNYFYLLLRYDKILTQRNKLLKETNSLKVLKDTLSIWDEQFSDIASKIIWYRLDFISKLALPAQRIHKDITDGKEELNISYQGEIGDSIEEIKASILRKLTENIEKDFNLKYTSIGPHRDDIKIIANNIDLRKYGSQGQQRLATLSIKIAELELFCEEKGETPILLLDDVLSELDDNRQQKFLKQIEGIQTILTCTKYNYKLNQTDKIFHINNGNIITE